jgi:hypothetical protein
MSQSTTKMQGTAFTMQFDARHYDSVVRWVSC